MNEVQLNPGNPRDAVQIIDTLTQDVAFKRNEANIFQHCLHTLNNYISQSKIPLESESDILANSKKKDTSYQKENKPKA